MPGFAFSRVGPWDVGSPPSPSVICLTFRTMLRYDCHLLLSGASLHTRAPLPAVLASFVCDAAYPEACIPPYPRDLICGDIPYRRFRVMPPDPHGHDRDGVGIRCER